jgi:hypothetical protein
MADKQMNPKSRNGVQKRKSATKQRRQAPRAVQQQCGGRRVTNESPTVRT